MSLANPLRGTSRIHGELLKLGIDVAGRALPSTWPGKARALTGLEGLIVCDHDCAFGETCVRRVRAMDIRHRPTAPQSPSRNAYTERLIGSIRPGFKRPLQQLRPAAEARESPDRDHQ